MSVLVEALNNKFKLSDFRLGQRQIIESLVAQKDVLAIMPTGGGKSLCYQLPAYIKPGLTIVISPLIALMNDQVRHLKNINLPAACLHSHLDAEKKKLIFRQLTDVLAKGGSYVLLLTPERTQKAGFADWIKTQKVNYFAIDEAHCVSKWGHDFRQEYSQLALLKELKPDTPIIALTATATPIVKNDIKKYLNLNEPDEHVYGFYRPNLYYQVQFCEGDQEKESFMAGAIKQFTGGRILVYCGTRKKTEQWYQYLSSRMGQVGYYHAGLSAEKRTEVEEQFSNGELKILAATNAFGMGVDLPDIRLVVHTQIPGNIESYYQEVGRAGRDGDPATCLMLYSKRDKGLQSFFINQSKAPKDIISKRWRALDAMINFAEGGECRHSEILVYFKDQNRIKKCGHCDSCAPKSDRMVTPDLSADSYTVQKKIKAKETKATKKSKYDKLFQTEIPEQRQWMISELKEWRKEYADENAIPAFMVFSDKSLRDLIVKLPQSEEELLSVYGFGDKKVEEFAHHILPVTARLKEELNNK